VGAAALMAGPGAKAAASGSDVWIVYPSSAGPGGVWIYVAWFAVSLTGTYVQLHTGGGEARARSKKK